ncbi:PIG-L family deacetylase [Blastococcus sp. TML/M2B]|uniref:PIG-L deacetylase family protein n=1 Tax=unclassified Blastococcus TaxID=2619396 RepID=UPI00190CE35E|nr:MULTISPECIES: PIG-L family deacetylase [unclassified Blastococcus]MBN1091132.1 PIG-L family deacetylase [Blastococcus sp. TML/M2B]MBN1095314.1 PIG-L family deacetylase [Blastococcus sp. TML/C7B]
MTVPAAGHRPDATPEGAWAGWLPGRSWPAWTWDPAWREVAVCAAHPDDEVLGVGGTMALLAAAGVRVHLVAVTDGEASHPGSAVRAPADLARARVDESGRALAALGLGDARTTRLGLPDSAVAAHETELVDALTAAFEGADAVLTTWSGDGHPDHDAVGRAAVVAGSRRGLPVWQYPVWTWHWAAPGDPRVPWDSAHQVALPRAVRAAKSTAIDCFTTQIAPLGPDPADAVVLLPEFLAHFGRPHEVLWR